MSERQQSAAEDRPREDGAPEVPTSVSILHWFFSLAVQAGLATWHILLHVFVFVMWLLPVFWDGKHYFYLARRIWAPGLLRIGGAQPATFEGGEDIDWSKPHVVVANHQGNTDIPLLFLTVPAPLRFLAKTTVGYIPILGWMLHLAGFPFIDRRHARKGRGSIEAVAERVRNESMNVAVFPEGTRSPEGTMLPFKDGAFLLAILAQVPVIPVAIQGSGWVLARSSFRIYPCPVKVQVGEPIDTTGLDRGDRHDVRARAEAQIAEMLGWKRIKHSELEAERAKDRERRYRSLVRGSATDDATDRDDLSSTKASAVHVANR